MRMCERTDRRALGSRQASVAMIVLLTVCLGLTELALRHAVTKEAVFLLFQASLITAMVTPLEISGRRLSGITRLFLFLRH